MKYQITEIFNSIQGEGEDTGMPVTFVRFAHCNLHCHFCDTDFDGFTEMTISQIVKKCGEYVIFTGGEPLMNDLKPLVKALGIKRIVGLETNGTFPVPDYLSDCGCRVSLSPKIPRRYCKVHYTHVSSLKILYPYIQGIEADEWKDFYGVCKSIQVIDPEKRKNIAGAIKEVQRLGYPWRLGIQIHKFIGAK